MDANGLLDEKEFPITSRSAYLVEVLPQKCGCKFAQADTNRDGKLDEKEFGQTFDTGNHTENRFKRTDGDKSGFTG